MVLSDHRSRRRLFYVALFCLVYVSIEGLCYLGLSALRAKGVEYKPLPSALSQEQKTLVIARLQDGPAMRGHHPMLGWTPKPNTVSKDRIINSQGIRSSREYARDVDPQRVRLSAFGDSFTFGSDVDNQSTWEYQLEARDARFEILNFGVGAYGLDQAYLRYVQEGVHFHSDIVVIGFMSENIYRNLNVFRPFYSSMYQTSIYTKPRFSIQNGNLLLVKNPLAAPADYRRFVDQDGVVLREIGQNDYYYQTGYLAGPMDRLPSVRLLKVAIRSVKERLNPVVTKEGSYATTAEAFTLTAKLFDEFHCAVLHHDSLPVIVVYPDLEDLARFHGHLTSRYEPLLERFKSQGFRYLDVLNAFIAHDPHVPEDRLTIGQWGHYSQLGNEIVAMYLQRYLSDQGLVSRDVIKARVRAAREQQGCRLKTTIETHARPGVS